MKVFIGKYTDRLICQLYTNYMNKKYGYTWKKNNTKFEISLEKLEDFIQDYIYQPINWLWFDRRNRKIKVKLHDYDTWGMDHTLSFIVLPMLKQLKEDKHGAPFVEYNDRPQHLIPEKEPEKYSTDEFHFDAWDWVLDEMIFAFNSKQEDWEEQFYSGNIDFDDDTKDTSEIDWEGRKKYQERITNGFILFGKYYESLWD